MKKLLKKVPLWVVVVLAILVVFCIIIGILIGVLSRIAPNLLHVLESGNQQEIEAFVCGAGTQGVFILFLLQFLQVVSIVFPGLPIQISAGVIYGAIRGFLICYLGYFFANLCVFLVARRLGGDRIRGILGSQRNKADFILKSGHPGFMVMIACMMPVVPNGIIPYIASITSVSLRGFCTGILCGSFTGILIFCAVGNQIIEGNFFLAILLCLLQIVLMLVLMRNQDTVVSAYEKVQQRLHYLSPPSEKKP